MADADVQSAERVEAFFRSPAVMQALLNLTVLEDGHPTHTLNDDQKGRGWKDVKHKDEFIREHLGIHSAVIRKMCVLDDKKARAEAAETAVEALHSVVYLLCTYAFDTARRFAVMNAALQPIHPLGRPEEYLRATAASDDYAINDPALQKKSSFFAWKERMSRAWIQLLAWHDKVEKNP